MTTAQQCSFLLNEAIPLLNTLHSNTKPQFGKMGLQQMIEHLSYSVRIANGKDPHQVLTDKESLPSYKKFLLSEKDFKPNTPNILLGAEPEAIKNTTLEAAIKELSIELSDFNNYFAINKSELVANPFFGMLSFDEWIQLLYKHFKHHFKQFGISI